MNSYGHLCKKRKDKRKKSSIVSGCFRNSFIFSTSPQLFIIKSNASCVNACIISIRPVRRPSSVPYISTRILPKYKKHEKWFVLYNPTIKLTTSAKIDLEYFSVHRRANLNALQHDSVTFESFWYLFKQAENAGQTNSTTGWHGWLPSETFLILIVLNIAVNLSSQ